MSILVTGGAGYIGSHTVRRLHESGEKVVVLDNLSTGHLQSLPDEVPFVVADLRSRKRTIEILSELRPEAVFHLAASCSVSESVYDPEKYRVQNVVATQNLLDAMALAGTRQIVFSSTAAVYGEPEGEILSESARLNPVNPYGQSKLACEELLAEHYRLHATRSISLRFFNAAGAHESGEIGEDHDPETHLIPITLKTVLGFGDVVRIFGTNYPTRDGTCVRDYVHVDDLAEAHALGLKALREGRVQVAAYNLGNQNGHTVREVIETVANVTGRNLNVQMDPPRNGDPAFLVASSSLAERELQWRPRYAELAQIVKSAWRWHRRYPLGYLGRAFRSPSSLAAYRPGSRLSASQSMALVSR
jgi:UDP-glucose 4-epimerase